MNEFIDNIFNALNNAGLPDWLIVAIIAALPISEARLAIPLGIKSGLSPILSFFVSFLGSSAVAPLICAFLIPVINKLSKTKLLGSVSSKIMGNLENKALGLKRKTAIGVFAFVALPLPLTGVWMGSAVAAIVGLPFRKAVFSVISGNFVAAAIIMALSWTLSAYIDIIVGIIAAVALITVITSLIRFISRQRFKKTDAS